MPQEILITTMRTHQKYFALRDPQTGKLANRFIVVANIVTHQDGGKEIVAGNERVLRARLSDAKFFWDQDPRRRSKRACRARSDIVFHAKLGTQVERVERIEAWRGEIASSSAPTRPCRARRASRQGRPRHRHGRRIPRAAGHHGPLLRPPRRRAPRSRRRHPRPLQAARARRPVPTDAGRIAVALADKLDTLVGFLAIDEKPTGSKDPFALRRAALGVIRIVLENDVRLPLAAILAKPSSWPGLTRPSTIWHKQRRGSPGRAR